MNSRKKGTRRNIRDLVEEIVESIYKEKGKYPANIVDLVFVEIEKNHMKEYNDWVNPSHGYKKQTLNAYISRRVGAYTDLYAQSVNKNPQSALIKSFSLLGKKRKNK